VPFKKKIDSNSKYFKKEFTEVEKIFSSTSIHLFHYSIHKILIFNLINANDNELKSIKFLLFMINESS
jgi:hypothetical protein